MKPFGKKIEEFLAEHKMTQRELADRSGVLQPTISIWISNPEKKPSAESLLGIANVFGCSVDYLLRDDWEYDKVKASLQESNQLFNIPIISIENIDSFLSEKSKKTNNSYPFLTMHKNFLTALLKNQKHFEDLFIIRLAEANSIINAKTSDLVLVEKKNDLSGEENKHYLVKNKKNIDVIETSKKYISTHSKQDVVIGEVLIVIPCAF